MCLSIPGKITEIQGDSAIAIVGGAKIRIGIQFIEQAKPGDYVLIHAGFAIQKIDKEKAIQTLQLIEQLK